VNASILSDTGGTCVCTAADLCVTDQTYLTCVGEVQRDLITGTAAIAALSSFLMGLLANLPVGLAPGLGLNAYVSRAAPCVFHVVAQWKMNASLSSLIPSWASMEAGKSLIGKLLLLFSWKGTRLSFSACGEC
jgi:xanthine/uracil/vitamin C permease (AzgA family)